MFKICIVGCGVMAFDGHGPAYRKYAAENPGICLAGCCDIIPEKAEKFRETFGFEKAYTDYAIMLEEIRPDVVCLISPVQYTSALAVDILKRGFALLLEKPPGRNRQEILAIDEQVRLTNGTARVAFNRRYTPLVMALKEIMGSERIMNITYQMYRSNRRDADFSTTAIHAIDAVSHIAGSPYSHVDFSYQELSEYGENVANIYMTGRMESGSMVQLSLVPMGGSVAERATVNTDKATYYVELPFWSNPDSPGRLRRIEGTQLTHDISGDTLVDESVMFEESGFFSENRLYFELLKRGGKVNDLPGAVQSVELADCIRKRRLTYDAPQR